MEPAAAAAEQEGEYPEALDEAEEETLTDEHQEELARQKAEAEAAEAERKRREYWPYDKYAIAKVR